MGRGKLETRLRKDPVIHGTSLRSDGDDRPRWAAYAIWAVDGVLWCLAWTLLGFAVALSLTPAHGASPWGFSDKIIHAAGYSALALSWLMAAAWFPVRGPGRLANMAVPVTMAVITVSLLLEVSQGFVGRDVEALDAVANTLGSLCGFGVWYGLRRTFERKTTTAALP